MFSVLRRLEYLGSETCTLISPQEFRLRREPRVMLFFCSRVAEKLIAVEIIRRTHGYKRLQGGPVPCDLTRDMYAFPEFRTESATSVLFQRN